MWSLEAQVLTATEYLQSGFRIDRMQLGCNKSTGIVLQMRYDASKPIEKTVPMCTIVNRLKTV